MIFGLSLESHVLPYKLTLPIQIDVTGRVIFRQGHPGTGPYTNVENSPQVGGPQFFPAVDIFIKPVGSESLTEHDTTGGTHMDGQVRGSKRWLKYVFFTGNVKKS